MMRGIIAEMPFRTGGFVIPLTNTTSTTEEVTVNLPEKSRILCASCSIENESTLIANGSIVKEDTGYYITKTINELKIIRNITGIRPLTILNGRELLYVDLKTVSSSLKAYLPKGSRINGTVVNSTGEITVTSSDNYLIEY